MSWVCAVSTSMSVTQKGNSCLHHNGIRHNSSRIGGRHNAVHPTSAKWLCCAKPLCNTAFWHSPGITSVGICGQAATTSAINMLQVSQTVAEASDSVCIAVCPNITTQNQIDMQRSEVLCIIAHMRMMAVSTGGGLTWPSLTHARSHS